MLLVDVSGSLEFGTGKADEEGYGDGNCHTGFSAIQNNDALSSRTEIETSCIPPQEGRKHILYIIRRTDRFSCGKPEDEHPFGIGISDECDETPLYGICLIRLHRPGKFQRTP